jgi:hypothetical protein
MTKAKKTKALRRQISELDRIAAKVRTALRNQIKNVIEIGKLLIESREHLEHGDWQAWLSENFDLSIRTAQRYVAAAEYVARKSSDTVCDFANLAAGVLYQLAEGRYGEQEEAAILAEARERRVDQDAADAICEKLAPPDDDDAEDDDTSSDDSGDNDDAEEDPQSDAIIDGPPPKPPPAPTLPPTDYALRDFDQAIGVLRRLMTKQATQFAGSTHSANDLEAVESFLHAVTKAKTTKATPEVPDYAGGGTEITDYDATDDFSRSVEDCYRAVRERKVQGGKGWEPR